MGKSNRIRANRAEAKLASSVKQKNQKKLTVTSEKTEVLSHNYIRDDGKARLLAPAVTVLEREGGKITAVFCGSPDANFNYTEGFAFLNETRKRQLIDILTELGELPIYYPGDEEFLFKAAKMQDGKLFAIMLNMSLDEIEETKLVIKREVKSIKRIMPNGSYEKLNFTRDGDEYTLELSLKIFDPIAIIID